MADKCATRGCRNDHSMRSEWCAGCRASLRRWIDMNVTERAASFFRAERRMSRVWSFRGRTGRKRAHRRAA